MKAMECGGIEPMNIRSDLQGYLLYYKNQLTSMTLAMLFPSLLWINPLKLVSGNFCYAYLNIIVSISKKNFAIDSLSWDMINTMNRGDRAGEEIHAFEYPNYRKVIYSTTARLITTGRIKQPPKAPFTSGIQYQVKPLPGYQICIDAEYNDATSDTNIENCCKITNARFFLVAAFKDREQSTFEVGAYGTIKDLCTKTERNSPHQQSDADVYWYWTAGLSFGFSRSSEIDQKPVDMVNDGLRLVDQFYQ